MSDIIERTLELQASPGEVWRALTEPAGLAGWFSDRAEVHLKGDEGCFEWDEHGRYAMRIEACEPMTRFAWRWARDPGVPLEQSPSTLVEWSLTPREDGGTTLFLRESGFKRDEDRQQNEGGWTAELGELVELLAAA